MTGGESWNGNLGPRRAAMRASAREMTREAKSDGSLAVLIGANLLALAIAWKTGMSLRELMMVYWVQSIVIGATFFLRIWKLERFDTAGFKVNGRSVEPTPATARSTALFFAVHFGMFHVFYLIFMSFDHRGGSVGPVGGYALCALVFAVNHGYSLKHNLKRDSQGRPNIGTLMFLPYARIVPMHLTIILGAHIFGGAGGFFLFGVLKILADAVMHTVEHHILAKSGTGSDSPPAP